MKELIAVRELAAVLGVSPSTVTYYTQLDLFEIEEIKGKRKLYARDKVIRRYENIQEVRKKGYPLALIKTVLNES